MTGGLGRHDVDVGALAFSRLAPSHSARVVGVRARPRRYFAFASMSSANVVQLRLIGLRALRGRQSIDPVLTSSRPRNAPSM